VVSPTTVPTKSRTRGLALLKVTGFAGSVCRSCKVSEQSPKVRWTAGGWPYSEHQGSIVGVFGPMPLYLEAASVVGQWEGMGLGKVGLGQGDRADGPPVFSGCFPGAPLAEISDKPRAASVSAGMALLVPSPWGRIVQAVRLALLLLPLFPRLGTPGPGLGACCLKIGGI
jgi:hypothetical protein